MTLLTPRLRAALRANDMARRAALRDELPEPDPLPLLKLFNPVGAATWIATELDADGDTLFGLADLGLGCPELGSFSLSEIAGIGLPFGLAVERDIGFETAHPLSVWADAARRAGSIIAAEQGLSRTAPPPGDRLPPSSG